MLILTQSETKEHQKQLKKDCEKELFADLDNSKALFNTFFPKAKIKVQNQDEPKPVSADMVVEYKINEVKSWINHVLEIAVDICDGKVFEDIQFKSVRIPPRIGNRLFYTILKIFTFGRDLTDNDYYFIYELSTAANMEGTRVHKIIDQTRYEVRKNFFNKILKFLDDDQCYSCAMLLIKAIRADNQIHPAEFKYIENITQLLKNDQAKLDKIERECRNLKELPPFNVDKEIATFLFKYLVEIVMCDGEYDARESKFLQEVAQVIGFSKEDQDNVIQPVASSLMVKASLFPKI
ncbi:MAG: TerB family tellurite resistance protein [Deltaproteobacteria bacterium]|nr:TerB family tellurite resistance protein [Deltaproteobacteria bacterium]